MALAIIDFILFDRSHAQFTIDTGTNPFYRVKIGRSVSDNEGIRLVDEVSYTSPMQRSQTGEFMLNTARQIGIPSGHFDRDNCYVQLFSFKTQDGRSPAWSEVVKVPVGFKNAVKGNYLLSLSQNIPGMADTFNNCRSVEQPPALSQQESLEDILLNGIKVVAPVVLGLLAGGDQAGAGAAGGKTDAAGKSDGLAGILKPDVLNNLLHSLLSSFAPAATNSTSKSQSLATSASLDDGNRFEPTAQEYARPFIFGIDDALLATLAGPIIKEGLSMLPQLLNAQNQARQQKQAATNKLITDLLADTNKRLMLQQILDHQGSSGATGAAGAGQSADVAQLLQLIQQAAATAPAADTSAAKSLSLPGETENYDYTSFSLSASSNLVFDQGTTIQWNGAKKAVYNRTSPAIFKVRLAVPDPAPKNPLDKAIFTFTFREIDSQKTALQKTFKQKNVAANAFIDFLFTKEEMASLPTNKSLMLFAEIRWLTSAKKEIKALGSTEVIVVSGYFVKDQGKTVSEERELNDMKVYRAFWNKVWEAPVLDATSTPKNGYKKYSWELNANMKYMFNLTAKHDSNGLLQTKILQASKDPDSLTDKTEGRMKGGIELSVAELNKLASLWGKQTALPDDKLEALNNIDFAKSNSAELIYNVKLKGKAGERGMVWVLPVLKLISVTLGKIKTTLPSGQVSETEEEIVQFPIPVAGRIIGLKSA